MKNWIGSAIIAVGVLFAAGAGAQTKTSAATNASPAIAATCKDGTAFSGNSKRGACAGHGGVKTWDSATSAAPATAPATAPAAPPPATKASTNTTTAAPPNLAQPGGGAGQVWVNTSSKVYHCMGSTWYGKTKEGKYMPETEAKSSGFRPAQAKSCS